MSRNDPMWKTLEGVLYTLDRVSYMVDKPVKPIIKPEKVKSPEKSPVLPRNTGINRGKLMRQLEESEYGIALRDDTLRRELREVIKYDCSNEAIEDFCQPSLAEKRFKYKESYKEDFIELPPVQIPDLPEFGLLDSSQFSDAEISQNDEISESSFASYQHKVKEPIIKPMNSLFRNKVNLKCRNALILNLKKNNETTPEV